MRAAPPAACALDSGCPWISATTPVLPKPVWLHSPRRARPQCLLHAGRGADPLRSPVRGGASRSRAESAVELGVKGARCVQRRGPCPRCACAACSMASAVPTRKRGSTAKYNKSTARLMTTKISAIRHRYAAMHRDVGKGAPLG
jgi:hypothetical protein